MDEFKIGDEVSAEILIGIITGINVDPFTKKVLYKVNTTTNDSHGEFLAIELSHLPVVREER